MNQTYHIRPLPSIYQVIWFLFLMSNQITLLILVKPVGAVLVFTLFAAAVALIACIVSSIGIVVMHRKPGTLHIHDSFLELYGRTIEREEVEAIWIRGYFNPKLGLKRIGTTKTLLPWFCFRMKDSKEEDDLMAALNQWADQSGIPVRNKVFGIWF